jgi:hypothetical protein
MLLRNSFQNPPNNFWITTEPFCLSFVNTLIILNIPNQYYNIIKPLSVLPYSSEYSIHHRDSSMMNNHQGDLEGHNDPCVYTKIFCRWIVNVDVLFPFVSVILAISKIWSSIPLYLVQSHYRHSHLLIFVIFHPCDLVTCCNFRCNLTEWA